MAPKILLIVGSARKLRLSPSIANLVAATAKEIFGENNLEIIDVKNLKIPFDAEEGIPKLGGYTNEQVISWSNKVKLADGFIVVSPEYNYGYPGALKHAFDVLYKEFTQKPATIVTFGGHGGSSSNEQLHKVLGDGFGMHLTKTSPKIALTREMVLSHEINEKELTEANGLQIKESIEQLQNLLKK
ncbi:uncharacterized protein PRCAT00001459001 [Priceomyces carsonii]|uniref:uncharacterized protein n=1 Tax=Priceomyces carsonii TaxID=28549 RepID=UPI002EDB1336|nr:unnamed protein product [Priceomyces carsonii]